MVPHAITAAALALPVFFQPLTIGSPAPKFDAAGFVMGEPVAELARGTVYVIEFSGTQCAPCVKAMPVLTALQKKHPEVVIISVYGALEKDVREALAKHEDKIGFRVALDRKWATEKAWMGAAGRAGIPDAYVVGKDGRIAWIGNPLGMAEPLARILAGTYDPGVDVARLLYQWQKNRRLKSWMEDLEDYNVEILRIGKLIVDRRFAEAVVAAEAAMQKYPGLKYHYASHKLWALAANPATADQALAYGIELGAALSIDQVSNKRVLFNSFAHVIVGTSKGPIDPRLAGLAVALAEEADEGRFPDAPNETAPEYLWDKSANKELLGTACLKAGLYTRASDALQEALDIVPKLPRRRMDTEPEDVYRDRLKKRAARIEAKLAEAKKAAASER